MTQLVDNSKPSTGELTVSPGLPQAAWNLKRCICHQRVCLGQHFCHSWCSDSGKYQGICSAASWPSLKLQMLLGLETKVPSCTLLCRLLHLFAAFVSCALGPYRSGYGGSRCTDTSKGCRYCCLPTPRQTLSHDELPAPVGSLCSSGASSVQERPLYIVIPRFAAECTHPELIASVRGDHFSQKTKLCYFTYLPFPGTEFHML